MTQPALSVDGGVEQSRASHPDDEGRKAINSHQSLIQIMSDAATSADAAPTTKDITAFIEDYARKERLANTRKKQLIKMATANEPPKLDLTSCCGSSCQTCVKDLHKEEMELWHQVRQPSRDAEQA